MRRQHHLLVTLLTFSTAITSSSECNLDQCPLSFTSCDHDPGTKTKCHCPSDQAVYQQGCYPCLQPSTSLFGDNILKMPLLLDTDDWQACRKECQRQAKCQFWTMDTVDRACFLKFGRGAEYPGVKRFISGSKSCETEARSLEVFSTPASGSRRSRSSHQSQSDSPQLQVLLRNGGKSVLNGLPATFGQKLDDTFSLVSHATPVTPSNGCSTPLEVESWSDKKTKVAIMERGDCKFVTKVKNAQMEGFSGVIILDNQSHTGFQRITGDDASITIPVIFLLKKEADLLRAVIRFEGVARVLIQSSSAESVPSAFEQPTINIITSLPTTPWPTANHEDRISFHPLRPVLSVNITNHHPSSRDRGNLVPDKYSPLMITFFVIAAGLLLAVATTFAMYLYHCHSVATRRRNQRTRCQRALAEMDAHYKRQRWEMRFKSDQDERPAEVTTGVKDQLDIKQTAKVLECPVCLETAWPPKKIFQCMQGHIICDNCRSHPQLVSCPMCRQVLSARNVSRNLALENLAVTLRSQQQQLESDDLSLPSAPTLDQIQSNSSASSSSGAQDNEPSDIITVQVEIEDSVAVESHDDNAPLTVILPPEPESLT